MAEIREKLTGKLTARGVEAAKFVAQPGKKANSTSISDGKNLYLRVGANGSKSWIFRWHDRHVGKVRELGLGSFPERSLAEAREKSAELRHAVLNNATREALAQIVKGPVDLKAKVFRDYAEALIADKVANPRYKSKKHLGQWTATLEAYAYPHIGTKAPEAITVNDIHGALKPIWHTKAETASRLRQRIEAVLDYAFALDDCDANNPARLTGRLKVLLGPPQRAVEHHRAVPWQDMPALMAKLRSDATKGATVLRFSILTAARSGEVRGACWSEIDLDKAMWVIPASRMKTKLREHRVPLNSEAVAILKAQLELCEEGQELVFPGSKRRVNGRAVDGVISDVAVAKALRLAYPAPEGERHFTPHGTARSSFRDWVASETNYPSEVAEWALAHIQADKVKAAYQRNDLFEKRIPLMAAWGSFLAEGDAKSNIVEFNTKQTG